MRPVRVAESAAADIQSQLPDERRNEFLRHDLAPALARAGDPDAWSKGASPHGPGWRFSLAGRTVAGFHLFLATDLLADDDDGLVVYAIDIWMDEFPD